VTWTLAPERRGTRLFLEHDGFDPDPREVALLAQLGLEPKEALAAASAWPRSFLGAPATADIVTYHHDPRENPGQLAHPAAVVAGGIRLR
jgi:imidazolonepropionase-like amidohydrolase